MAERFEGCEVKVERDKSLLVFVPDIDREPQWIPKFVVHEDSPVYRDGQEGVLILKSWWCEQEGWI